MSGQKRGRWPESPSTCSCSCVSSQPLGRTAPIASSRICTGSIEVGPGPGGLGVGGGAGAGRCGGSGRVEPLTSPGAGRRTFHAAAVLSQQLPGALPSSPFGECVKKEQPAVCWHISQHSSGLAVRFGVSLLKRLPPMYMKPASR